MKTVTTLMAIGMMGLAVTTWAANPPASLVMVPPQINYQGRLVTISNTPYADAVHTIDLTLYPDAVSPTKLWSERYGVQTKDGYFSVNLGSGGQGLLTTNLAIWQVMWRTNGSPDTFFMAMTVRTAPNGGNLSTPVEATPRQQFLTAPFAYRAHQSLYASKADGMFDAPQGVQSPVITTTNSVMDINAPNWLTIRSMNILGLVSSNAMVLGSILGDVGIAANRVMLAPTATTTNILVNGKAMFVMISASTKTALNDSTYSVFHGINTTDYDVMTVGFDCQAPIGVRTVNMPSTISSYARVYLINTVPSTYTNLNITVRFLGIRRGLILNY